jgi:hypothetical protein
MSGISQSDEMCLSDAIKVQSLFAAENLLTLTIFKRLVFNRFLDGKLIFYLQYRLQCSEKLSLSNVLFYIWMKY